MRELLKRGEPPKGVFRRGEPTRRRDAMSKGEDGGVACDHVCSSIQSTRFGSMHVGLNQPTKLEHEVTDIISLSPAGAGPRSARKLATHVAIATNKTMEMRLNRSGNVLPLLLECS